MQAILALEDGWWLKGRSVGAAGEAAGEVVFYTGMSGYQEALTDPSQRGQIVAMTHPLIGNYGVNDEDWESGQVHLRGLAVHQLCAEPSNWRSKGSLQAFLKERGVIAIEGVDTRALTRRLRSRGSMRGILAAGEGLDPHALVEKAKAAPWPSSRDLVSEVTAAEPYTFADGTGPRVAVLDLGCKRSLLKSLAQRSCRVRVLPADADAQAVLAERPDGLVISNGPGDPKRAEAAVETVRRLIGKTPILGVGLGHQILALALGGDTFKLKHGHRGPITPSRMCKPSGFSLRRRTTDTPWWTRAGRKGSRRFVQEFERRHSRRPAPS